MMLRSTLASTTVITITLLSGNAAAFKTQYHEEITKAALPFMKPDVMERIIASNHASDDPLGGKAGKDKYHFNDCGFHAGSIEVRRLHDQIIQVLVEAKSIRDEQVQKGRILHAAAEFGTLLHAVQDFYAHSNWVEWQIGYLVDDVFGTPNENVNERKFPLLEAWQVSGPFVFVGATAMKEADGNVLRKGTLDHTIEVLRNGTNLKGIMTGSYDGEDEPHGGSCPASVDLGHWDHDPGEGMHKDEPSRPYFTEARKLAFLQTRREWCRLQNRMHREGLGHLTAMFVDSTEQSNGACSPSAEPPSSPLPRKYLNLSVRGLFGMVSGAGAGPRPSSGIDFGARIETRYGILGPFVGYRGEVREGSPLEHWLTFGVITASPSLMGGPYGALRADYGNSRYRIGIDLGYDLRLQPKKPLFHALRIELGGGARIDDFGVRPDFRLGLAYGANADLPY